MESHYGAHYRTLYDQHWWWRSRERIVLDVIGEFEPSGGYDTILDVGCGDGLLFEKLHRFGKPQGIEFDATLVTPSGSRWGPIHIGPLDSSFQPGYTFPLILMLDVIEHVKDDVEFLRNAVRLLSDSGKVVITVPAMNSLWTSHDEINHHFRRYDTRALRALLSEAGMSPLRVHYFYHWMVPLKLGVRAIEKVATRREKLPSIPPAPLNAFLQQFSYAEYRLLRRLRLPFGTSLLAVAAKQP